MYQVLNLLYQQCFQMYLEQHFQNHFFLDTSNVTTY